MAKVEQQELCSNNIALFRVRRDGELKRVVRPKNLSPVHGTGNQLVTDLGPTASRSSPPSIKCQNAKKEHYQGRCPIADRDLEGDIYTYKQRTFECNLDEEELQFFYVYR